MTLEVTTKSVTPQDISLTLNGSAQQLVAANKYRTHLQFQAPQSAAVTYSYTNSSPNDPASTLATGCFILPAGATWSPSFGIPGTAIWVNGGVAGNGLVLPATEC